MSTMRQRVGLTVVAVVVVVSVALLALNAYRAQPQKLEASRVGEAIQFDDFAFAVVTSREVATLGDVEAPVAASGHFLVVTMRVINHAKRVGFRFRPDIVRVVASDGAEYVVSAAGQSALGIAAQGCSDEIAAGSFCTTELAFDVAERADDLRVRMSFGGLGDLLDRFIYGNRVLKLD